MRLPLLCCLLLSFAAHAEQRHYDDSGRYLGRTDDDGRS